MRPQPRMQNKKHTSIVTTVTPERPGIPRAMVLTVSFVISPVIGLFCHRHLRCRKLDASVEASGPHDFAVRVSTVRQRCLRVHRIPCPTSVTIAKRPSVWDGMARVLKLIWVVGEAKYFSGNDWTTQITLIRFNKFACARTPAAAEFQASAASQAEIRLTLEIADAPNPSVASF